MQVNNITCTSYEKKYPGREATFYNAHQSFFCFSYRNIKIRAYHKEKKEEGKELFCDLKIVVTYLSYFSFY